MYVYCGRGCNKPTTVGANDEQSWMLDDVDDKQLRKGELLTTRGSATAATDTYRAATIDIAAMSGPHPPGPAAHPR